MRYQARLQRLIEFASKAPYLPRHLAKSAHTTTDRMSLFLSKLKVRSKRIEVKFAFDDEAKVIGVPPPPPPPPCKLASTWLLAMHLFAIILKKTFLSIFRGTDLCAAVGTYTVEFASR
jgi:hypothetical protein